MFAETAIALGDVCTIIDCEHKTAPTEDTGIPLIRTPNIGRGRLILEGVHRISESTFKIWTRRGAPEPGDLIMAREAPVGNVAIVPPNARVCLGQRTVLIRVKDPEVDSNYLNYLLSSSAMNVYLNLLSNGATVGHLNVTDIRRLKLPGFPSMASQQKIAAILSAYDELMENNRRRIALLEKLAEGIYREWFVRLRFPGHEKVKLVKGRPETWSEKKFGNFCVLQRGHDLPDADVVPGPYPIIASTSIKGYHHEFKALPPVVTTGRSGSLGEVLLVHTKAWPLNTALYVKDFCGNSPFLVYYTLKNMGLEKFNAGAGVPSLNRNHLTGIKINVPDAPLQKRFDELVGPIHEQKEQLVKMNEALRQTRDLLLPRLISGKLSVEDLDIQFPPGMAAE
jgi:type I restriction enzyme S subunit